MRLITSWKSVEKEWGPGPGPGYDCRCRPGTSRFCALRCRTIKISNIPKSVSLKHLQAPWNMCEYHSITDTCWLQQTLPFCFDLLSFPLPYTWVYKRWSVRRILLFFSGWLTLLCQELFATVRQAFLIFLDWLLCLIHSTVALFDSTSSMFHRCHPPRGETWQDGWEQHLRRVNIFGVWKGVVSNSSWKAKKAEAAPESPVI